MGTLDKRFEDARKAGGGIQPGTHPENPHVGPVNPLPGIARFMRGLFNSTGSHRSPSTVRDTTHTLVVRTPAQEQADYEKELAARKHEKP